MIMYKKSELDYASRLYTAEQEGYAEGFAIGKALAKAQAIAEGKIESAKKMLAKGIKITDICEITGLSEKDFH